MLSKAYCTIKSILFNVFFLSIINGKKSSVRKKFWCCPWTPCYGFEEEYVWKNNPNQAKQASAKWMNLPMLEQWWVSLQWFPSALLKLP